MTTARWREYSIAVWIILAVITGLILWFAWPFIKTLGTVIQLAWVVVTSEWTEGGFQKGACECVSTLSKTLIGNCFIARNSVIQLLSAVNRLTTYEPLYQVFSTHLSAITAIALVTREAHMDIPDGALLGLFVLGIFTIFLLLRKKQRTHLRAEDLVGRLG